MPKTPHILDETGHPFCGTTGSVIEISELTASGVCGRCLSAYRTHARKTIDAEIDRLAQDLAAYITLIPEDDRFRENQVLMKSIEVRIREALERA